MQQFGNEKDPRSAQLYLLTLMDTLSIPTRDKHRMNRYAVQTNRHMLFGMRSCTVMEADACLKRAAYPFICSRPVSVPQSLGKYLVNVTYRSIPREIS